MLCNKQDMFSMYLCSFYAYSITGGQQLDVDAEAAVSSSTSSE